MKNEDPFMHDFAQEFATLLLILDHDFGDDANDGTYYRVHNGTLMIKMSKRKERKSKGDDPEMILCQNKADNPS